MNIMKLPSLLNESQAHNAMQWGMQCVLICQRTGNWKSKEWEVGGEWKREWEFAQSCTGRDETISYTVLVHKHLQG